MKVSVKYVAQLKRAAGTGSEELDLPNGSCVADCLQTVTREHTNLQRLLFGNDGALQSTILVFVGEDQVEHPADTSLKGGDVVTLLSPIAGG